MSNSNLHEPAAARIAARIAARVQTDLVALRAVTNEVAQASQILAMEPTAQDIEAAQRILLEAALHACASVAQLARSAGALEILSEPAGAA
jgi:hypothetical protein